MTREEKQQFVKELSEKIKNTNYFYIADTSTFTVPEINNFRKKCFEKNIEYKIVKNKLIEKALERLKEVDYTPLSEVLKGTSGLMFAEEAANVPARLIRDFKKTDKKDRPKFKAASIYNDLYIGEDQLSVLAGLKSKDELLAEIINLLQSPVKNVISSLKSGEHKLAGIIKTISEKGND